MLRFLALVRVAGVRRGVGCGRLCLILGQDGVGQGQQADAGADQQARGEGPKRDGGRIMAQALVTRTRRIAAEIDVAEAVERRSKFDSSECRRCCPAGVPIFDDCGWRVKGYILKLYGGEDWISNHRNLILKMEFHFHLDL
ncbi:MAG: hypothetical protein QM674_22825 [Burkholderiaceae bacterium]